MRILRIASLLFVSQVVLCEYSCPTGWAGYGDWCYWMSNVAYDYNTSRSVCQNFNGDLVAQNTVEEKNFTESLIYARRHDLWFGLKQDDANAANWVWTDGTTPGPLDASLVNWACDARPEAACNTGEGVGPCGTYRWHSLKWENHPCDWSKPFMCRRHYYASDNCDLAAGWHQYSGKCYQQFDEEKSWQDAKAYCDSLSAQLVMLKTAEEVAAFEHLQWCTDYSSATWLGASDTETVNPNTLMWVDNSTLGSSADWAPGQPPAEFPHAHRSNCVASYAIDFNKWRVTNCGDQNKFMCQKEYGVCAEGWKDYGTDQCYLVVSAVEQHLTWPEARDVCNGYSPNSVIMKIIDWDEQDKAMKSIYTELRDSGSVYSVRIGISDQQYDNDFRWTDGQHPRYTNWNDTWRQETPERWDCGYVDTTSSNPEAKWGTNYCFDKEAYICRMPKFETPNTINEMAMLEPDTNAWQCENSSWILYGANCYLFLDDMMPYDSSKAKCQEYGATPTTIHDENEQVFISNNLRGETWLGLRFDGSAWKWDDGSNTSPTFMNWAAGGKNEQSTKQCSRLQMDPVGQWYNSHCSEESHVSICKKAATESPTEPPSTAQPTGVPCHEECGCGWHFDPYAMRCFKMHSGVSVNWEEALRRCTEDEDPGSNIASITGPTEQQYINALLYATVGGAVNYWVGLNERDPESGWQWADGEAVPYFNWNDGEPNNYGGEEWCVELSTNYNGRWNDHNCSAMADGYICKKVAVSAVETTTAPKPTDPVLSCEPQPMVSGSMWITDSSFKARNEQEGREAYKARTNSAIEVTEPPETTTPEPACEPAAMVSGTMYITDPNIIARTELAGREAYKGRMNSGSSWEPSNINSTFEYIEVFFPFQRIVQRLQIAGAPDKDHYVTRFKILYQAYDGVNWDQVWFNDTAIMHFDGNTAENKDQGKLVDLPYRIYASAVRFIPLEWNKGISMRIDVDGCVYEEDVCQAESSVGGTGWVLNHYLTASHEKEGYEATQARYIYSGWEASEPFDSSQYLQIEFETRMTLLAIGTKGRADENRYVKTFKMKYYDSESPHEDKWSFYDDPYGSPKVFTANTENTQEVKTYLDAEVTVDKIQIIPEEYNAGKAMRVEVYACLYGCKVQQVISGEGYTVPDSSLTASSSYDGNHGPHRSRLYTEADGGQAGAWCVLTVDLNQWIQVDLGQQVNVRGIATQGRPDYEQWVESYYLQFSETGEHWIDYYSDRSTNNNATNATTYWTSHSQNQERRNYLEPAFLARHVRLRPQTWYNSICMRWDVLACPGRFSYELIGCHADFVEDRDLPHGYLNDPEGGMTHEICVHHCYNLGYIYAGVQYGIECWCGNEYGTYGQSSNCDMACSGNPYQNCGGHRCNYVMSTGMAPDSQRCPDDYTEFEGSCYKFVKKSGDTAFSWNEARYMCQQDDAELVSISSEAENNYVLSNIALLGENAWIGLHSLADHMFFEWSNYDVVDYTNWARREPNAMGGGEDCVVQYFWSGQWNDDSCDANVYGAYVCEKGKESLPPATSPPPDPGCGEGWHAYRWKCYHFVTAEENWDVHRDSCVNMQEGASLARIEDNQEQAYLASFVNGMGGVYYMDLNDRDNPGTYVYTDGNHPTYTHWGINQPDQSHNASCVALNSDDSGLWYDKNCDKLKYAICEKPHATETRPPTVATDPPEGGCSPGWEEFNDYCYMVRFEEDNMRLDWGAAQAWCQTHNANLTSVHSDDEAAFLLSIQDEDHNANYWIGLSRATINDSFSWVDGSVVEYVNWQDGEPAYIEGHHCVQHAHENGKWETMTCDSHRCYICKIKKGMDVTIPSTTPYPTPDPNGNCDPNGDRWKYYNGKCYFFSDVGEQDDQYETWYDGEAFCNLKGGHLVSIHSQDEMSFVMGQARTVNSRYLWIGLNDITGSEQWSDGMPLEWYNWAEGQPNDKGGTEMCVGMSNNQDLFGPWTHMHCGSKYSYICKKNPGNTDPPSTVLPTPAPGNCPEGYEPFLDKCFKFFEEEQTWNHSKYRCSEQNTENNQFSLATIHNLQENAFLTANLAFFSHQYWIGLHMVNDDADHGFGWVDSTQVTFTNWAANEPNGGETETCVEMYNDEKRAGQWNDIDCASTRRFICMTKRSEALPTQAPPDAGICAQYGDSEFDYIEYNGDCFKAASGELRSWQAAEDHCSADAPGKGHLASVRNIYEQSFIYSIFFYEKEGNDQISNNDMCWIGLSDYQQEGRFTWTDNAYVSYTNWGGNEPNQDGGGCVQFGFMDSLWYDAGCSDTVKAICRISEQPIENTRPPNNTYCPSSGNRDQDWLEYNGRCYMFIDETRPFGEARQSCEYLGADLASILDNDTNAFIQSIILPMDFAYPWWIGLMRTYEGWQWTNSDPVSFTFWADGEPSDVNGTNGEECTELYYHNGRWNDIQCTNANGYICMQAQLTEPASTTPEPSFPPEDTTTTPTVTYSTMGPTNAPSQAMSTTTTATTPAVGGEGPSEPKEPLPPGDIVGIVFAVMAVLLAAGIVLLVVYKRRQYVAGDGMSNPLYGEGTQRTEDSNA